LHNIARFVLVVGALQYGAWPALICAAGQAGAPIIDMHLHAGPAAPGAVNPATGKPTTANTDDERQQKTLDALRHFGIVKAVTSGPLPYVERMRQAAPDRIVGGPLLSESCALPSVDELRAEFGSGRLHILGELGAEYLGLNPSDAWLEPYLALAEELDIPVAIHTGLGPPGSPYDCCPKFRTNFGNPQLLEPLLVKHPKLRVYIMHAGWPYLQETKAILYMYPQVNADLAVIDWIIPREEFHDYLKALVRAGFGKRLMFGSDQMIWPESIKLAIEGIESARFLNAEQKRDIFYNNAARFLRLDEKPGTASREP
jgi:uncharacterized protein